MPQWQGGDVHDYWFGSRLLAWLAPAADGPVETVPVPSPESGETLELEDGLLARAAILEQARAARAVIERHQPDRIVMLGGDCLVSLASFAYLNARCGGALGVLWVDAHPDVVTPEHFAQGNAMVLGALLGQGDPELVAEVAIPLQRSHAMHAGLDDWTPEEGEILAQLGLRRAGSAAVAESSAPVLDWIREEGITSLAIHLDVDSMDPRTFGPILFNKPDESEGFLAGVPRGRLTPAQVVRLLAEVAAACDVVGLSIAEFLPWEAIEAGKLLRQLPLLGGRG
jgi:arginase